MEKNQEEEQKRKEEQQQKKGEKDHPIKTIVELENGMEWNLKLICDMEWIMIWIYNWLRF